MSMISTADGETRRGVELGQRFAAVHAQIDCLKYLPSSCGVFGKTMRECECINPVSNVSFSDHVSQQGRLVR